MPVSHPSANPYRNLRLREAAAQGMMISLRCGLCRRTVRFWAADLVDVLGPDHQVHLPPFDCSRCKTKEFIDVRWSIVGASAAVGLTVRRPVRREVRWIWRDEPA